MSLILNQVNQEPASDRVDRVALRSDCAGEDVVVVTKVVEVVEAVEVVVVEVLSGNRPSPRMITVAPGAGL